MSSILPTSAIGPDGSTSTRHSLSETLNDSETNKYITFKLANYLFALPSERILKVVTTPPPSQGGMVSMGLVQLEQYSIQTLNLTKLMNLQQNDGGISKLSAEQTSLSGENASIVSHESSEVFSKLKDVASVSTEENPPFLVVMQDADNALWGIAVQEPPDLMDIPRYALKTVPSEKRLTRALRWVSHVVTYDLNGERHTLLILDLSVLFSTRSSEAPSNSKLLAAIEPPLEDTDTLEASTDDFLGIEPPIEMAELEVEQTGRKEEMYA